MKLKKIYCKWFPPKEYSAITILFWMIIRKGVNIIFKLENHENIHLKQELEIGILYIIFITLFGLIFNISCKWLLLAFILFYILYGIEYLIRLCIYKNHDLAYRNISFEQEAYLNELDSNYLENRKPFSWMKYLFKKSFNN